MRIIAGERRGHKLEGPKRQARPTSDLVRESIFNILSEVVEDRPIVDLFAGTGALGLEALSRGGLRALFVERDRGNIEVIHRNIAHLRYEDRTTAMPGDAYRWMKSGEVSASEPMVVLVDPPYRDYENQTKRLSTALAYLTGRLPGGSIVVLEGPEHGGEECLSPAVSWDVRYYGGTMIAVGVIAGEPVTEDEMPAEPTATSPD